MKIKDNKTAVKIINKVAIVTIVVNLVLAIGKFLAGIFGNSTAMISDAVHSSSDVLSTLIVLIGARIAVKNEDKDHNYGHDKFESIASILLAMLLFATALALGYTGIKDIISATKGDEEYVKPTMLALIAAIVSIVVKEGMYWYTIFYAKKLDSQALKADAWHHRSDALSSVGALIGIAGARMGFPISDPLASVVICFFIEKAAFEIFRDAVDKMVDKACDEETEQQLKECALSQEGVLGVDLLHTRVFGNMIYVDIEIRADGNETLRRAHGIAERVHDSIEKNFPKVKHIMVHVNPNE